MVRDARGVDPDQIDSVEYTQDSVIHDSIGSKESAYRES
jgi:hypothetical protein